MRSTETRSARIAYVSTRLADMIALPIASGRFASTFIPVAATLPCLIAD